MRSKLKKALAILASAVMCVSMLLNFPNDTFEISLPAFAAEDTATITGVSITVDGTEYESGTVTITPDSTVTLNVTGTNLQNGTEDNRVEYAYGRGDYVTTAYGFTISDDGTTATRTLPAAYFANSSNFEIGYYNNYTDTDNRTRNYTGIYVTYVRPTPDSDGKIVVDMNDAYGDGWNGAAVQVYKDGTLVETATVQDGKTLETASLEYDPNAKYEFVWVKGDFDYECSFIIWVDGESKLEVNNGSTLTGSETFLTLEAKPVTYTVNIAETTNGTVTASPTSAVEGATVTLTATPATGYLFGSWTVTDADGTPVTVENNQFTMPASAVTASATFAVCDHSTNTGFSYTINADDSTIHDVSYQCCGARKETNDHTYENGICICKSYVVPDYDESNGGYQLSNAGHLFWFAQYVNEGNTTANAVLLNDIDLGNAAWTPIGASADTAYSGNFDGCGHTVSGLNISGSISQNVGFIGNLFEGGVQNLTVSGSVSVEFSEAGVNVGMLVGHMKEAIIYNCKTLGSVSAASTGTSTLLVNVGGMLGLGQHGIVINCGNEASVSGNYVKTVGGLVGYLTAGYDNQSFCLLNSYCFADVSTASANELGGLAAYLADDAVNNYYSGTITSNNFLSGYLFGEVANSIQAEEDNTATSTIDITLSNNYYLTGNTAVGSNVTGLDAADFTTAYTSEEIGTTLADSLNGNLSLVDEIIAGHLGYLTTTQWADLISKLNGESVKAIHWVTENGHPVQKNCTDADSDSCCDICGRLMGDYGTLKGSSISLAGNIGLNFYFELTPIVAESETAFVLVTLPDGTTRKLPVADAGTDTVDGTLCHRFSCDTAAAEMTDDVKVQIFISDADTSGSNVYTYSVAQYAQHILDNTTNVEAYAAAAPLVRAMLNYGAAAQTQFDYNTEKLANASLTDAEKTLAEVDTESLTAYSVTGTLPEGVTYYGSSLLLYSNTVIRHYFVIEDGTEIPTVSDGWSALQQSADGNYYYTELANIAAAELDEAKVLQIGDWEISYSAMSYVKAVLSDETTDEALANVLKALHAYNAEANKYFTTE